MHRDQHTIRMDVRRDIQQPTGPNPAFKFVCPNCGDTQDVWPQRRCKCGTFHLTAPRR